MQVNDPTRVPLCRCCGIGHWTDEVDPDGFCLTHARAKCQPEREEGYYWVTDLNHPDPLIAYYGETQGTDQIDRSKTVSCGYEWDHAGEYSDDDPLDAYEAKGTLVIHGPRIKAPDETD